MSTSELYPYGWVEELEIGERPYNVLKNYNVQTISELVKLSPRDLLRFRGCGIVSVREIEEALALRGLSLAPGRI